MKRLAWWLLVVVLTAATFGAASVGGWQSLTKSRPAPSVADQAAARQAAVEAASNATVKILTYSPDTIDQDIAAATLLLTGDFLDDYKQTAARLVPTAKDRGMKQTATVKQAGVQSLSNSEATILVFVDQTRTAKDTPDPTIKNSAIRVGLTKVNKTWLISKFDPV